MGVFRLRVFSVGDVRRLVPDGIKTVGSTVKVKPNAVEAAGITPIILAPVAVGVSNRRRLERLLRTKLHAVGRQYEESKRAYTDAKSATLADLPTDDEGRARIVCRRHAEKRAVSIDADARPSCYDPEHPDCRGCVEDIREERIETW
jgi:hypothetical protein